MQRDSFTCAAARTVGNTAAALLQQLTAATDIEDVKASLKSALYLFIDPNNEALHRQDPVLSGMQQALQLQAQLVGWQRLHKCFMEDQYPAWATAILTGIAMEERRLVYHLMPAAVSKQGGPVPALPHLLSKLSSCKSSCRHLSFKRSC